MTTTAPPFTLSGKSVWVAGHAGLVGQAVVRALGQAGTDARVLTVPKQECDLRCAFAVDEWVKGNKPDVIVIAAARVGGIADNRDYPVDYLYDNLMIAANVLNSAHRHDVNRVLALGSSCIYPRECAQPIPETALMTGALEPTNAPYAVAKIAALALCDAYRAQHGRSYIAAMPCNLYGPGDRFDAARSHVIPALMLKMHNARTANAPSVTVGGDGTPLREFLYADDLAQACLHLLAHYDEPGHVNIGSGDEISIAALARAVADAVGYAGDLVFDTSYPNGTPRKVLDSARMRAMGWRPHTALRDGLARTYDWFLTHAA